MFSKELDNPGRGNCAFYGFALGLIDIIKHEMNARGKSVTFERFKALSKTEIQQQDLVQFDFLNPSKPVLDVLQGQLRQILFTHRQEELLNKKEAVGVYNDFAELVRCTMSGDSCSSFNELAKSKALRDYARVAVDNINRLKKRCVIDGQLNTKAFEQMVDNTIKSYFYQDVFIQQPNTPLCMREESEIIKVLKNVTINYRWGTQEDLGDLANCLHINLHTLKNGKAIQDYTGDDQSRPVISINKKFYPHWTTHISFLKPTFEGKSYHQFTKDSCLTKAEIQAVMQSYTTGFMATFSTRHHRGMAKQIISHCQNKDTALKDIVGSMNTYLSHNTFEPNSSFEKRLKYLLARHDYQNISTEESHPVVAS